MDFVAQSDYREKKRKRKIIKYFDLTRELKDLEEKLEEIEISERIETLQPIPDRL